MNLYRVESFDNYDRPYERLYTVVDEFDTPARAIACAQERIRLSLERLWHPGATGTQIFAEWANAGEGVRINGPSPVEFNAYVYARLKTTGRESIRILDALQGPDAQFLGW